MPQTLKLAASQSRTLDTTAETLRSLEDTTRTAASQGIDLILFPEAFLGGYPRTCTFGAAVGARDPFGREQFLQYFHSAVDLGDTPTGSGDDWIERRLPVAKGTSHRGDGTREELEQIARETKVFIVTGLVEKSGGTLYCAVVYVCPQNGVLGKRRKVMPTGSERLIWGQGQPSSLRAVTTTIRGVKLTLAAAICWENYMPLLRHSLYSQNVNVYLAPTADARDTWLPLMRTIGAEGRAFVLSANQCVTRQHLPAWVRGDTPEKSDHRTQEINSPAAGQDSNVVQDTALNGSTVADDESRPSRRRASVVTQTPERHEICWPAADSAGKPGQEPVSTAAKSSNGAESDFVSRGGSCIVSPLGEVLAGPLWEVEDGGLLTVEVDFEDCERGRLDLDVAGSYSRNDAFKLTVEGLELDPPP
ncbi:carbon-nitrogen hydrolase [Viridothelium virens]|uniref:Carbon-nitrogen hydrolase n=1 Tax=Viridothelium virens TaxID=1048519 RepID=A0A6A6GWF6_VIRVR|nr:carbon-nitrogen hydrolase [Viridothelium virens]